MDTIRAKDIDRYIGHRDCVIVDLRSGEEYQKSHIPSAVNVPYEEIDDYITYLDQFGQLILYCERGSLSLLAARELSKLCGGRVISVGGGYRAYQQYNRSYAFN